MLRNTGGRAYLSLNVKHISTRVRISSSRLTRGAAYLELRTCSIGYVPILERGISSRLGLGQEYVYTQRANQGGSSTAYHHCPWYGASRDPVVVPDKTKSALRGKLVLGSAVYLNNGASMATKYTITGYIIPNRLSPMWAPIGYVSASVLRSVYPGGRFRGI
jgi:hypothetical protein